MAEDIFEIPIPMKSKEGTMTTTWELPTANVFWKSTDASAPATAIKGLSWSSVVTCQDCHTGLSASGPHGAAENWGIDRDYPGDYSMASLTKYVTANPGYYATDMSEPVRSAYLQPLSVSGIAVRNSMDRYGNGPDPTVGANVLETTTTLSGRKRVDGTKGASAVICAKCHDLENQVPLVAGGPILATSPVTGSNTGHNSHHQDQTDGSDQCVSCHIAIPHGWKKPRLLVNTSADTAPYLDERMLGTSRSNSVPLWAWNKVTASWESTTSTTGGWARIGMLTLSAVDNHVLTKNATDPSVFPAAGLDSVATDDMAYWSEPGCQACNGQHAGEDGVRILESGE